MEQGRSRFILRSGVLPTLIVGIAVVVGIELFQIRHSMFSLRADLFVAGIMLPIFLLGGYLEGRWKWQDLKKKYPD